MEVIVQILLVRELKHSKTLGKEGATADQLTHRNERSHLSVFRKPISFYQIMYCLP